MEESINESVIHRFLNKETTEPENLEILLWVSASEENRDKFRRVHQIYHSGQLQHFRSDIDVDKAWDNLNNRLPKVKRGQTIFRLTFLRRIAVAILIFMTIGFASLWTKEHFFKETKSAKIQFEVPKGAKSRIILADGTLVWLNSHTVLTYDALSPRNVTLVGEAYFEVEKDNRYPFFVSTLSGMKVEVTGTRFNLRSFPEELYVETTLEEGKVHILGTNSESLALLIPGQQSIYDIRNSELQVHKVSAEIYSLWKNNELRFSDITFEELVPRIERWYGISIKLDPKVDRNDRFTMTVKTESLRELLTMMQLTSKFKYEINGSQVEIYFK